MTRRAVKGYGPPCPHCGHIMSSRIANGWSEPDDHYLRYKRCAGCEEKFATVEVAVDPTKTTFYRLDYLGRTTRRERWRRRYAKTTHFTGMREKSDELKVTVTVKSSSDFDKTHCMRGHALTLENTYITPSTKYRRCKLCRDVATRSYYIKNRENWNKKRRAA